MYTCPCQHGQTHKRCKSRPDTPTSTWHCNEPQRHDHKLQPAHDAQQNAYASHSVQASGVFCLDLLALALSLRAITTHVANFATKVALATETFSSSSSSRSTQFHGRITIISTCTTMIITAVLWASRRVLQGLLPRARKPHSAISAVSQRHGMTNSSRVP